MNDMLLIARLQRLSANLHTSSTVVMAALKTNGKTPS
jgi:hypothetical protein